MALRIKAVGRAVLLGIVVVGGGCSSNTVERTGLVLNDLPSPVQAAFSQNHERAVFDPADKGRTLVTNVTERSVENGQRTFLIEYTNPAGEKHSVEYNVGGDEINCK